VTAANMIAADLKRTYLVSNKKAGKLRRLIEDHSDEFEAFLERVSAREQQWLLNYIAQLPQSKTKVRTRPTSDAKRAQNPKQAKNRYEYRRRQYRDGLIQVQFGKSTNSNIPANSNVFSFLLSNGVDRSCLDKLLGGEKVPLSGTVDSFENLLGVDRHHFPKSLPGERHGRRVYYGFGSLLQCMFLLLKNGQWLRNPTERRVVLRGVADRVREFSPKTGDAVAKVFESYIS